MDKMDKMYVDELAREEQHRQEIDERNKSLKEIVQTMHGSTDSIGAVLTMKHLIERMAMHGINEGEEGIPQLAVTVSESWHLGTIRNNWEQGVFDISTHTAFSLSRLSPSQLYRAFTAGFFVARTDELDDEAEYTKPRFDNAGKQGLLGPKDMAVFIHSAYTEKEVEEITTLLKG